MVDYDRIATLNFKVDAEGRIVFYPYGIYGKGRILPDRQTAEAVLAAQNQIMVPAFGAAAVLLGAYHVGIGFLWILAMAAAFGAMLFVVYWLRIRALVLNLQISDEPFDFEASLQANGRSKLGYLIGSLVFALVGFLIMLFGKREQYWVGIATVVFFGAAFVVLAWQALARARRRSSSSEPVQQFRQPRDRAVVSRNSRGFGKRKAPPET